MNPKSKEIMMGILAFIMLLIYSLTLGQVILSVWQWDPKMGPYVTNVNLIWVINLAGGLVSGVVIANLAKTRPGTTPLSQVQTMVTDYGKNLMQTVVWIYLLIWLIIGLGAFYVGVLKCPDISVPLTEIGKSWLGILAGALFAWFGIDNH